MAKDQGTGPNSGSAVLRSSSFLAPPQPHVGLLVWNAKAFRLFRIDGFVVGLKESCRIEKQYFSTYSILTYHRPLSRTSQPCQSSDSIRV